MTNLISKPIVKPMFALRLQKLIERQHMPMKKLVKESGIKYQIIYRLLKGKVKKPNAIIINKLAKVLGSTHSYIVDGRGYSQEINDFERRIPILSLDETYEWCKSEINNITQFNRQFIRNPINDERNDYFAVKIMTDSMEGEGGNGLPKGAIAICMPKDGISLNKYLLFYDISKRSAIMREAIIEDKVYLKPLNSRYSIKESHDNIKPIAEVVGIINFFSNFQ